jgi:hypothetical protein
LSYLQKYFIPKLKEWIVEIVSGKSSIPEPSEVPPPNPAQEAAISAAAAAAAAATAATQMAAAMQEIAKSKTEGINSEISYYLYSSVGNQEDYTFDVAI